MGIAFSMAVGKARAKKALGKEGKVYVIMSDGEMDCGNVLESMRKAGNEKLDNLVVIVDYNGFTAMGKTVITSSKILDTFLGYEWDGVVIDGHNFEAIEGALNGEYTELNKPICFVAKTIKGKGVSFMENDNSWHYRKLDKESYELASKELGQ